MPNPVMHWEIMAQDAEKLQHFYRELFGWRIDRRSVRDYGVVSTDPRPEPGARDGAETDGESNGVAGADSTTAASKAPRGLTGGIMPAPEGVPSMLTVYARVDDLAATLTKAEALGGATVIPPTEIPSIGSFALFADPEGNVFGLFTDDA